MVHLILGNPPPHIIKKSVSSHHVHRKGRQGARRSLTDDGALCLKQNALSDEGMAIEGPRLPCPKLGLKV